MLKYYIAFVHLCLINMSAERMFVLRKKWSFYTEAIRKTLKKMHILNVYALNSFQICKYNIESKFSYCWTNFGLLNLSYIMSTTRMQKGQKQILALHFFTFICQVLEIIIIYIQGVPKITRWFEKPIIFLIFFHLKNFINRKILCSMQMHIRKFIWLTFSKFNFSMLLACSFTRSISFINILLDDPTENSLRLWNQENVLATD